MKSIQLTITYGDRGMFLKSLDEEYQIWFFYPDLIDTLLHLFISDKLRVMRYYYEIDNLVRNVRKFAQEDTCIFIISDHGMKQAGRLGVHSDYGFWSSNIHLNNFSNPRSADFYNLWKKILEEDNEL